MHLFYIMDSKALSFFSFHLLFLKFIVNFQVPEWEEFKPGLRTVCWENGKIHFSALYLVFGISIASP